MTISYEDFGRRFVESVLTAERIEQTLKGVVAGSFETSTRLAAGIVRAEGVGEVTSVEVDRVAGEDLFFRAQIFTRLTLAVRISGVPHRYDGKARIELDLHPVLHDDLAIFIDIPDVTDDAVTIELSPLGRVAGLLDQVGSVAEQARREIASFVNTRKEEPAAVRERRIDVVPAIEAEWSRRSAQ